MVFDLNALKKATKDVAFEEEMYDKALESKRQEIAEIEQKYDEYFTEANETIKKAITKKHSLIVKMMKEDDSWRKDYDACEIVFDTFEKENDEDTYPYKSKPVTRYLKQYFKHPLVKKVNLQYAEQPRGYYVNGKYVYDNYFLPYASFELDIREKYRTEERIDSLVDLLDGYFADLLNHYIPGTGGKPLNFYVKSDYREVIVSQKDDGTFWITEKLFSDMSLKAYSKPSSLRDTLMIVANNGGDTP